MTPCVSAQYRAGRSRQASYPREQRTPDCQHQGAELRSGTQGLNFSGWWLGSRVGSVDRLVRHIAGWRAGACSWHGAGCPEEAAGWQRERLRGMGLLSRESVAGQVELTDTPPSKSL